MTAQIRVELPLPIDISATLTAIIGKTWPGSVIKDDGNDKGWNSERRLVFEIPDGERHKSPKHAKKYAKLKEHLSAYSDVDVTDLGPNKQGFSMPEYLALMYTEFAREAFNQEPRAKNYIETKLQDKETGKQFVFTLARSKEQTPHALRMKAEAERDALKAKLETTEAERDQYKRELDAVPWEYVPKDIYDRAINDTADT